jgi:predicted nucleic acid-binding Zn ribbon protein
MGKPRVKEVELTVTRRLTLEEKTCPVCGKTFWGAKVKRYCSRACQNKANYERHAEEYRQQRLESYRRQKERAGKE